MRWLESVRFVALSLQMADRMESCRERMRQTDLGSLPEAQAWLKEQLAVLKAQLQSYKESFRATRIEVTLGSTLLPKPPCDFARVAPLL